MAKVEIEIEVKESGITKLTKELESLKKALEETTDPKEIKKFTKSIDDTEKSLVNLNKSLAGVNARFDEIYGDLQPLSSRLGELEDRLYELALAGETNTEEFKSLQSEAIKYRQTIIAVDKSVDALADNKGLAGFGNLAKGVGQSLLALDFTQAKIQAQGLAKLSKTITFKEGVKGVKELGSVFINLGKALLTNPLFLIAGIIALAVAAIVKLLDKMGVLKKIGEVVGAVFEFIGEIIDDMVDKISAVVDFLFGTTLQAEKFAQAVAKQEDAQLENTKRLTQDLTDRYTREINEATAAGKSVESLERQKREAILQTAKVEFDLLNKRVNDRIFLKGLSEDEIKDLKKQFSEAKKVLLDAKSDLKVFNLEQEKERDNDAKKTLETAEKTAKTRADNAKQYRADRLAAQRNLRDLELANEEEGLEKSLALNAEKFARLIEDTKTNEKLLSSEKKKIAAELAEQELAAANKLKEDDNNKRLETEKQFQAELASISKTINKTEKELLDEKYESDLNALQLKVDKEIYTIEQGNLIKAQLEENLNNKKIEIDAKFNEREAIAAAELNATDFEGKLAQFELERQLELEQKELTESEKALIDAKFQEKKLDLIKEEQEAKLAAQQEDFDNVSKGVQSLQNLSDTFFEFKTKNLKKGSAEELAAAKKQFKINKTLQLAAAGVDAAKAVLTSLASSPVAIGPIPNPAGIASLALVATASAANIAKIASAKFESPSSSVDSPNTSSVSSASASGTNVDAAQPQVNLFGNANVGSEVGPSGAIEASQQINVNATVSVEEITSTQNRVTKINESSVL